jgi:flagellar hook protein FlgE
MMRSLYSGVAGLRTHQTKMDVLGNNIANVNTTSYKSQSITFSDLMYQTTQTASGATATKGGVNARQIGLGAKSGAISTAIESQGATQTTNNPFDIMITGDSFFIVNNGKENLYTRDGSFYIDGAGNLAMQSNGYFVQGWAAKENKETGEITVDKNGGLTPLQIMSADNSTYSPASTSAALYSGNIDDHDTNVTSDDGKTITLEFYDNKGYLYTGKFTLKDTGTDHLFSLQLKDILDSSGNTINKVLADGTNLMDHITFGTTDSKDYTYADTYDITVGTKTSDIYQKAGTNVYKDIPRTGVLSDLMTSSKTTASGALSKLYGISDAEVISQEHGYSKSSTYAIDDAGTLTITYEKDYVKGQSLNSGYSFKTANTTDNYYVSNGATGIAYQVPTNATGKMKDLIAGPKTTLKEVFGMDAADITKYTADESYSYTFTSKTGTSPDVFTVSKSTTLPTTQSTTTYQQQDSFDSWDSDFMDASKNLTLASTTNAYKAANPDEQLFYSYASGTLKVVGSKLDDSKAFTPAATAEYTGTISEFEAGKLIDATALSDDQKLELATVLDTAYGTALTGADDAATIGNVETYLQNNNYKNLLFGQLTGTVGLVFYTSSPSMVADPTKEVFTGTNFSKDFTAAEGTGAAQFTVKTPKTYFKHSDGYAYVLSGNESKLGDYNANVLNQVYGIDPSSTSMGYSANSLVKFSSTGAITIYDNKEEPLNLDSNYATAEGSFDTTINYVTKNPTIAYDDVPLTGNIVDLLSVATGDGAQPNLLKNVYGVTDEDADAYGTDGTYKINNDGSISLYTGTQTIQLMFNAANGSLTTANGQASGLVNMKFDQSIDGLEAFGFQVSNATDPAELAKKGTVEFDFSTVTNYNTSGSSTIKAVKGDKKSLNTGRAVGEMNGVNISTDGQIYATYSNGQTKLLGQIASAQFANASGLSKEGDNLYASTLNSGEATVQDITTDGGYMNTGVLEMSNVDLSREFTEMITTQRGFQANSRIITVSDTLLEELTNLKR